jgi:3'(2'), 5'-bisphosphate nucleotidase
MNDTELAAALARGAGAILLQVRETGIFSGKSLGDIGDELAHRFIACALAEHRPADGLLSEESADSADRLAKERVWIVDPLDGTREYSEGRSDWAVHVALAVGGDAAVGSVALPARGLLFRSDEKKVSPKPEERLKMVVSRTRPPREALDVADMLGAELIPMGSCGAKAMAVVMEDADIYLHSGGQHEWDSCAPVAVARVAGLHCSRLDGSPLLYNRKATYLPDLLICRRELAEPVLEALSAQKHGEIS